MSICGSISDRHFRRLLERYREHGTLSLVNRRRGQPSNRQLMPDLAERALRVLSANVMLILVRL